jgi:hypothetical protein
VLEQFIEDVKSTECILFGDNSKRKVLGRDKLESQRICPLGMLCLFTPLYIIFFQYVILQAMVMIAILPIIM